MTKRKYIFPTTRMPRLEQIIEAYYNASGDDGITSGELATATNRKISQQDCSGSVSFLRDIQVLEPAPGRDRHRLTSFGREFGAAITLHTPDIPGLWDAAVRKSAFMMKTFHFIEEGDYIKLKPLARAIVRQAGGELGNTPETQASTLITILKTAGLIQQYRVDNETRVRVPKPKQSLISIDRIYQLESCANPEFDLSKLIQLCKAINTCHQKAWYSATGMLIRVLLDYVPPIFGRNTFGDVIAHYDGDSFKKSMRRLNDSGRDVYNIRIHEHISRQKDLANPIEVDVGMELNLLLGEIIKQLNQPAPNVPG